MAIEAKEFNRHLNAHINSILKQYYQGNFSQIKQLRPSARLIKAILSQQKARIVIYPYKAILNFMPSIDPLDIAKEIEAAITCYVIAILSDKSDHTQKSRELAQEILTHLTAWERQSKLFDECEVELEAKNDEEE